jgi:bla regulator protein BlaR1
MIIYILKSASCLAMLLAFYHLVLEKEKMHVFNRFYLLGSVLFSFLAPLYIIYIDATPVILETIQTTSEISLTDSAPIEIIKEKTINYTQIFIGTYILISFVLLMRFGKNIFNLLSKIRGNTKINYQNAKLVLVDDHILPHTFWNYIFINKSDYENQKIEQELFTHELTHVTQKHTLDVLILEVIQIIFWINPFFIILKKAVQLNHEFLADEKVINQHNNTIQYQHLLLNSAAWKNDYYLASNLNYSLTKKRLLMMTTQSSHTKILLKKLAVVTLLAGFVFLFAERVEAQEVIYEQEVVTRNISDDLPLETIKEQIFTPKGEKVTTGFTDIKGVKYYFVTIGNTTKYFNKDGKLTDNSGKILSNRKVNASNVIPGNYIAKTYFNGKVFCEFNDNMHDFHNNRTRNDIPPPPKPKVKKTEKKKIDPVYIWKTGNKIIEVIETPIIDEIEEREDELLIPPTPPNPNASREEILKVKKAYKAWKKRAGNDIPPPPPPIKKKKIDTKLSEFKIRLEKKGNKINLKCLKGCEWKTLNLTLNRNLPQIVNKYGLNASNTQNSDDSFYFVLIQDKGIFDLKSFKNTKWKGLSGSSKENMKLLINEVEVESIIN